MLQVALGGVFGAAAREVLAQVLIPSSNGIPYDTLLANLSGAFLLGVLLAALIRLGDDSGWLRRARLTIGTGFMGAYTTYSTLAVQVVQLTQHGHTATALTYLLISVPGGLLAVSLGILVASALTPPPHRRRMPVDPDVDEEGRGRR
jgi:fluoride exporter